MQMSREPFDANSNRAGRPERRKSDYILSKRDMGGENAESTKNQHSLVVGPGAPDGYMFRYDADCVRRLPPIYPPTYPPLSRRELDAPVGRLPAAAGAPVSQRAAMDDPSRLHFHEQDAG